MTLKNRVLLLFDQEVICLVYVARLDYSHHHISPMYCLLSSLSPYRPSATTHNSQFGLRELWEAAYPPSAALTSVHVEKKAS